ncbi:MAG TPA: hypothetical protein VFY36_09045 [Solirubrobacteraceae bacterium]|nr:hypothetical protein [Solirubrobacteraceae bacterium]
MSVALFGVFVLAAVFYYWRATYATPMDLYGGEASQYNRLADAFLHFHLWVVNVPAEALGPGDPYNPAERSAFLWGYPDYSLFGHYLYITWGAVPVLVWLVPLHLFGFEPSSSVISTPFAIIGLGFALATLRVILRQIGNVSLWMCILAAFTLAIASTVPFILRFPLVYHEEIASAYCFSMAAVWFVVRALVDRRASLKRLVLMSACVGLATGSRPTLAVTALLLVPVYMTLRSTQSRRDMLVALLTPLGVCLLLLLAYNQARYGSPLEYGARYQINGPSSYHVHLGELSFLPPGLWSYLFAPPRLTIIFPFLQIVYPQISYPFGIPAHYAPLSEETGGLFAMAPIAIFLVALPWMWRRRPALLAPLGSLKPLFVFMAIAGFACMAFVAYEIYISSERYETDYISLLLFGSIAVWLALSSVTQGRARRLVRVGGGILAVWSCLTGLAISGMELERRPSTWRSVVSFASPLSTAMASIVGHPVLAEVNSINFERSPPSYSSIGTDATGFSLSAGNDVAITIVSPDRRTATLDANVVGGPGLKPGKSLEARVSSPGGPSYGYRLVVGGQAQIPVKLERGVNQLVILPGGSAVNSTGASQPEAQPPVLATLTNLSLAG